MSRGQIVSKAIPVTTKGVWLICYKLWLLKQSIVDSGLVQNNIILKFTPELFGEGKQTCEVIKWCV